MTTTTANLDDELSSVVEDREYTRAMMEIEPQPTRPFTLPTLREADEYFRTLEESMPDVMCFDNVIGSPLGYMLVRWLAWAAGLQEVAMSR